VSQTPVSQTPDVLAELSWRGLIAQSTDEGQLRTALAAGPVTAYCGFDPTAPSLHFGNFVQLVVLRRLQQAGHRVICLVGGSTGLIGDPRPTAERVLRTKDQTAENVARIKTLVRPFLDFAGANPALLVDNLDWTAPMSALDFLRDVGKHFRVNQMIRKDAVAARLESQEGISYTEFSYQLLQALDYLHLFREFGCTLQTGGSDQWGNLTAGVDLIHRVTGSSVHALTTPLLIDASGVKFGKSEGNAIWLSADMTSPYAFHQYFLNTEDASVARVLRVFSDRDRDELEQLELSAAQRPQAREAQRALARDVTTLVHGAATADRVEAAAAALFGRGELTELDPATLSDALAQLPGAHVPRGSHAVADLLKATGLVASKSAGRRAIGEGGAYVNNVRVEGEDAEVGREHLLHDRWLVIRRGRRSLAAIDMAG
jgi:tyrosyl-tRNA synthetase